MCKYNDWWHIKEIMFHFLHPMAIIVFACVIIESRGAYLLIEIDAGGIEKGRGKYLYENLKSFPTGLKTLPSWDR